jgi:hypothetical protein
MNEYYYEVWSISGIFMYNDTLLAKNVQETKQIVERYLSEGMAVKNIHRDHRKTA